MSDDTMISLFYPQISKALLGHSRRWQERAQTQLLQHNVLPMMASWAQHRNSGITWSSKIFWYWQSFDFS